jgi:hypothetical protein
MTQPADTAAPNAQSLCLDLNRAQIRSLQHLLADLATFFDLADRHVADAAQEHFEIGDADGWLSAALGKHAHALADAITIAEALYPS